MRERADYAAGGNSQISIAETRCANDIVSVLTRRDMSERDLPPEVKPKDVGFAKQSLIDAFSPQASLIGLVSGLTVMSII